MHHSCVCFQGMHRTSVCLLSTDQKKNPCVGVGDVVRYGAVSILGLLLMQALGAARHSPLILPKRTYCISGSDLLLAGGLHLGRVVIPPTLLTLYPNI